MERDAGFRRGVSMGLFVAGKDDVRRPVYEASLDEIAATGATDLQLAVYWGQHDVTSSAITPHVTQTVDDDLVAWVMKEAKQRSLRVFLRPVLHVEKVEQGEGRATLAPKDADSWWWSYRRFMLHYARMAESGEAALLSVGSELRAMEGDTERWRELIGDVRKYYHGPLTYASNGEQFEKLEFWDALDVVGVAAQPTLLASSGSDEALRKGFAPFAKRVRTWATENDRTYVFTEAGAPGQVQREVSKPGAVDAARQLRYYRAFYTAWQQDARLTGLYVSNWAGQAAAVAAYSPRNRPAEKVLSYWFQQSVPGGKAAEVAAQ